MVVVEMVGGEASDVGEDSDGASGEGGDEAGDGGEYSDGGRGGAEGVSVAGGGA